MMACMHSCLYTRRIALELLKEPKSAEALQSKLSRHNSLLTMMASLPAYLHTRRIALELLKEPKTAEALARRLSIVCLEDGLLHPQLPLVVWAMLALVGGWGRLGNAANRLAGCTSFGLL